MAEEERQPNLGIDGRTCDSDNKSDELISFSPPTALFVCRSCRPVGWNADGGPRPGSLLVSEVERVIASQQLQNQITVLPIHCLARCARSCAAAILPRDGARVLFDELEPNAQTAQSLVKITLAVRQDGARAAAPERCPPELSPKRQIE